LLNLKAQVALRHSQAVSGFAEVACFSSGNERNEVTKLGTLDHDAPTFLLYFGGP
jgi:hypothetical protein